MSYIFKNSSVGIKVEINTLAVNRTDSAVLF